MPQLELLKQPPKLIQPPVALPEKQAPLQHLKSEQKVTLPSTEKAPAPRFDIAHGAENKKVTTQPVLKKGQQLMARMLQLLPAGKAIIEIQGQQIEVKAPPGISAGDHILLRVSRIQPQAEFVILDTKPDMKAKVIHQMRKLLVTRAPTGTNMMNLQQALNTVVDRASPRQKTGLLQSSECCRSGLNPRWMAASPLIQSG